MRHDVPDGGYDGEEEEESISPRKVRLERIEHFYSVGGDACSLQIDGVNRGLIYLNDDEFNWLKDRIDGEIPRHD